MFKLEVRIRILSQYYTRRKKCRRNMISDKRARHWSIIDLIRNRIFINAKLSQYWKKRFLYKSSTNLLLKFRDTFKRINHGCNFAYLPINFNYSFFAKSVFSRRHHFNAMILTQLFFSFKSRKRSETWCKCSSHAWKYQMTNTYMP